jgi:hypothetical protein
MQVTKQAKIYLFVVVSTRFHQKSSNFVLFKKLFLALAKIRIVILYFLNETSHDRLCRFIFPDINSPNQIFCYAYTDERTLNFKRTKKRIMVQAKK